MSLLRHREIYRSDMIRLVRERRQRRPRPHRLDEFPAGYSSAGCPPAEPASASPAVDHSALQSSCQSIAFHRTANSVLTVCLSPGARPNTLLCHSWHLQHPSHQENRTGCPASHPISQFLPPESCRTSNPVSRALRMEFIRAPKGAETRVPPRARKVRRSREARRGRATRSPMERVAGHVWLPRHGRIRFDPFCGTTKRLFRSG